MGYLSTLNRELRNYQRGLYARKRMDGKIVVFYRADRFRLAGWSVDTPLPSDRYLFALTDNWSESGNPVEWGIEPVLSHLSFIDEHRDDSIYDGIVKERVKRTEDLQRQRRNELRAISADARRDFAKATNDINTSILEKTDRRREKWQ